MIQVGAELLQGLLLHLNVLDLEIVFQQRGDLHLVLSLLLLSCLELVVELGNLTCQFLRLRISRCRSLVGLRLLRLEVLLGLGELLLELGGLLLAVIKYLIFLRAERLHHCLDFSHLGRKALRLLLFRFDSSLHLLGLGLTRLDLLRQVLDLRNARLEL